MTFAILVSQRSRVQIPYGPEFFFRPYFHYGSSSVHYCEVAFIFKEDIADHGSMQDACHMNFVIDLVHRKFPVAQW